MWAFDSFAGLPPPEDERDHHPVWQKGAMRTARSDFDKKLADAGVSINRYSVVEGYFDESLVRSDIDFPEDIALAYIDCDLYSSTRDVLAFLAPRLKHGMILAFDDYFCWSATHVSGERAAFAKFAASQSDWLFHRYREYGWAGCSYVVERGN
jgi:O-methyltransferase